MSPETLGSLNPFQGPDCRGGRWGVDVRKACVTWRSAPSPVSSSASSDQDWPPTGLMGSSVLQSVHRNVLGGREAGREGRAQPAWEVSRWCGGQKKRGTTPAHVSLPGQAGKGEAVGRLWAPSSLGPHAPSGKPLKGRLQLPTPFCPPTGAPHPSHIPAQPFPGASCCPSA